MVAATDLKLYRSTSDLGGAITGTQILTATPNNFFTNIPINDLVTGKDYYGCIYLKNTNSTEAMNQFKLWLASQEAGGAELKWGYDPTVFEGTGYRWSPAFDATGSTFDSTADTGALDLSTFTVACWFITDQTFVSDKMIVNKGGLGDEAAGQNMNYGIWMPETSKIRGGFEEADGTDHFVTSPSTYNNNVWHFAVCQYDGTLVQLFIDNMITPVATHATTATPETNAQPLVVGRNSRASDRFFIGQIDEVRVWNVALSQEQREGLLDNNVPQTGLVHEDIFGAYTETLIAQVIANANTSPVDIEWRNVESPPNTSKHGNLGPESAIPIWLWRHVDANTSLNAFNDGATFGFNFDIPSGGTGSGGSGGSGGGTGGNPPPVTSEWKIAIAGDWGCESATDDVIDLIQRQDYDYVVGVGDNSYSGSASCWTDRFSVLKPNFNSAYGNHEHEESSGINPYKTFFGHSNTYFGFQFQNVYFIVMDTNISTSVGSNQYNFVKAKLEEIKTNPNITWRVVIFHHPMYGADSDHPTNEFNQVQNYHTLFTTNNVNFVCTGHNHNWQRTHQLQRNTSSASSPTVVDNSSPYSKTANGLIHVISGAGGHDTGSSLYDLGSQPSYQAYQNTHEHNGVWEMAASNNGQTLTCSFVGRDDVHYDTFVITAT